MLFIISVYFFSFYIPRSFQFLFLYLFLHFVASFHKSSLSFSVFFSLAQQSLFFGINPSSFIFNLEFIMHPFNSMRTDGRVNQLPDVKHILGWLSKSLSRQISSSRVLSTFVQRKKTFLSHWSPFATLAPCL